MWQATIGPGFWDPVTYEYGDINARVSAPSAPPNHELDKLQDELDELQRFDAGLKSIFRRHPDPYSVLLRVYFPGIGPVVPGYLVFCSGAWEAYFRIDDINRSYQGLVVRNTRDPIATQLDKWLGSFP